MRTWGMMKEMTHTTTERTDVTHIHAQAVLVCTHVPDWKDHTQ